MAERLSVAQLQSAVDKAVENVRFRPGPIILGFIPPEPIDVAEAERVAQEVTRLTGIAGTPTVQGIEAAGGAEQRASALRPPRIIIGLIAHEAERE